MLSFDPTLAFLAGHSKMRFTGRLRLKGEMNCLKAFRGGLWTFLQGVDYDAHPIILLKLPSILDGGFWANYRL